MQGTLHNNLFFFSKPNQQEKKFFYRVSELLSKPIIFILNNRWDMSEMDTDKEMVEKVKLQHMRFNTDFLVNELKVATSLTARDRAFFVSGKEALLIREARAKGRTTDGASPKCHTLLPHLLLTVYLCIYYQ